MAEPARKLDVDAPERHPTKRTESALGKVVDLNAYREKTRQEKKRRKEAPKPAPKAPAPPAEVVDLERERRRRRERETVGKKKSSGALGPVPVRTPLQMATALGAAQARDRLTSTPAEATLPAGTDERVFLELDPRSYAMQEQTAEQKEKRRQAAMMEVARKFTAPGGEAEEEAEPLSAPEEPEELPEAPPPSAPPREAPVRIAGELERGKVQERMTFAQKVESAENLQQRIQSQRRAAVKANKSIRRMAKLIQAAGIETIIPLITLIIQLNLETINKWIFKMEIPGIILVDRHPKLDATDAVTLVVDFLLVFALLVTFLQISFFLTIWIIVSSSFVDVLSSLFNMFAGLF